MWNVVRKIKLETLDQTQCDESGLRLFSDGQCYYYYKYNDGKMVLPYGHIQANDITIDKCKTHCFEDNDYLYAGVWWKDEWYCGNVEPSDKRSASNCNSRCDGNSS